MIVTGTGNSQASAQSVTTTTPAAAAAGKRLYFFWQSDSGGAQTVTPPTGASELIAPVGGDARMAVWYLDLVGAPAANYTVSTDAVAANIALNIVCVDMEGGSFVSDTVVARTFASTTTTSTSTSATNAGDVSVLLLMFGNDDNASILTPPSGMTLLNHTDMASSELATYYEIGFTTGTRQLIWGATGDVQCGGVVVRTTAAPAGPTITTQPTAATAVVHPSYPAEFTVDCDDAVTGIQWQDDGTNISGADISVDTTLAAGESTLTVTPAATTRNGSDITAECTDAGGTTESDAAVLTVLAGVGETQAVTTTDGSGEVDATLTTDVPSDAGPQLIAFITVKVNGVELAGASTGAWLAGLA